MYIYEEVHPMSDIFAHSFIDCALVFKAGPDVFDYIKSLKPGLPSSFETEGLTYLKNDNHKGEYYNFFMYVDTSGVVQKSDLSSLCFDGNILFLKSKSGLSVSFKLKPVKLLPDNTKPSGYMPSLIQFFAYTGVISEQKLSESVFRLVCQSLRPNMTLDDLMKMYNLAVSCIKPQLNKRTNVFILSLCPEDFFDKYEKYIPTRVLNKKKVKTHTGVVLPDSLSNFVYRVENPHIFRDIDNSDTSTFDFIEIYMSIPLEKSRPDRKQFIYGHLKDFVHLAKKCIQADSSFKKYNFPINQLKLTESRITECSQLWLLFEKSDVSK